MSPHMLQKTKLVRDGNSWAVRLPKMVLQLSGFRPGTAVQLEVRQDRIVIFPASRIISNDRHEVAKQDAREVWNKAFEDVWLEIFGLDE